MTQEASQEGSQGVGIGHGAGSCATQFRPGVSGNPAGSVSLRVKLQRKIAELAVPYGGAAALAPDELELLRQAAILSTRRVSDIEQQVRVANALRSIFELLADRHRGKGSILPAVIEGDVAGEALRHLGARDGQHQTS